MLGCAVEINRQTVSRNVWGLDYVNQLVERDDNSTSGRLGITGSGLGRRLYGQQDSSWSLTSLVNVSGNVVQRMTYLPHGAVAFLTDSWTSTNDGYAQNILLQGGRLETATGNYIFDYRDYDTAIARWREMVPIGAAGGNNSYEFTTGNPIAQTDNSGLLPAWDELSQWLQKFPEWLKALLTGTKTHQVIQGFYTALHPFDFLQGNVLTERGVGTVLDKWGGTRNGVDTSSRIDIAHRTSSPPGCSVEVYEIKSTLEGAAAAVSEASGYVAQLKAGGLLGARLGPKGARGTEGSIPTPFGILSWSSPEDGAIVYKFMAPPPVRSRRSQPQPPPSLPPVVVVPPVAVPPAKVAIIPFVPAPLP